ncbi:hypothetical protein [Flavobacterium difficile]|uniref:Uncharacterized protein n=1 Tax=Flavobacterium difficile TaxID=2709659 RepID=A0ABX0I3B8_9FLAO|nr:hypothetical protein [Flavobacterium difficile]NHM01688.1 hypothetical protein [Flavobacterium difficile]
MKKYLLIIIVYSTVSYAQTKDANSKTYKAKSVTVKIDTIKATVKDKPIVVSVDTKKDINIILAKEEATGTDWAKYALPIITLFLGIGINRLIDWNSKRNATIRNGERWVVELRSTEVLLSQQVTDLIEFRDKLSVTEFVIPEIKAMTNINGDIFKSLDKSELIKYIEIKNSKPLYERICDSKAEKEKAYKEVVSISNFTHGHIAIMEHQFKLIGEKFNSYLSGTSGHVQSFNKHLQEFLREYGMYNLDYEKEGVNIFEDERTAPLCVLYTAQIVPHIEDGEYNPFKLRDEFFIPSIRHLSHYRFEEKTLPLTRSITACLNDIAGIKAEVGYMTKNVNIILERYTELANSLPNVINDILGEKG